MNNDALLWIAKVLKTSVPLYTYIIPMCTDIMNEDWHVNHTCKHVSYFFALFTHLPHADLFFKCYTMCKTKLYTFTVTVELLFNLCNFCPNELHSTPTYLLS